MLTVQCAPSNACFASGMVMFILRCVISLAENSPLKLLTDVDRKLYVLVFVRYSGNDCETPHYFYLYFMNQLRNSRYEMNFVDFLLFIDGSFGIVWYSTVGLRFRSKLNFRNWMLPLPVPLFASIQSIRLLGAYGVHGFLMNRNDHFPHASPPFVESVSLYRSISTVIIIILNLSLQYMTIIQNGPSVSDVLDSTLPPNALPLAEKICMQPSKARCNTDLISPFTVRHTFLYLYTYSLWFVLLELDTCMSFQLRFAAFSDECEINDLCIQKAI